MAIMIKCNPMEPDSAGEFDTSVPAFKGCEPAIGDVAYIWFAETRGGNGLFGVAKLTAVEEQGRQRRLRFKILRHVSPGKRFGLAELFPAIRDYSTALGTLAHKLYVHSLNKVANLDDDEAALISNHFD